MDEKDNSRSSLQTAADLGRAAKAAYRIAQAAAVSGVHGAAAAAVKETVPALVKFFLAVLLILIVIPMVVFTALPNIFFGYDSSDTASVIHMTEQAMRIGGAYMSLDDFERTQIDSIVTGIAAEYEADGTAIDHIEVKNTMKEDDLLWIIAINSAAYEQDLDAMSAELIQNFCRSTLSYQPSLSLLGGSTSATLEVEIKRIDPEELMEQMGFNEDARQWAGALFETLKDSGALEKYGGYFSAYQPDYSGDGSYSGDIQHGTSYDTLKAVCEGRELPAYEAAAEFTAQTSGELDNLLSQLGGKPGAVQTLEKLEQAEKTAEDKLAALLEQLRGAPQDDPALSAAVVKAANDAESKRRQADAVNKLVDAGLAQNQAEAGALIARAVSAAAERAEEVQTILGAWSDAPGDMRKTDANAALLERVRDSKTLQDISRYLGRFREIFAQGKRNGYAYGRGEKYALELGNDLSRALTSELAMLAVPETLPLFLRKYQHRQIKQYRRREPVYKGAGDIICCLDESGSTAGDLAAWGKAVALTLLEIAQSEGRKFALVHFSGPGRFQTDVFLPGQSSLEEKLHAAETFLGGGTDFQTPLAEAERLMREGGFENADIAFITDGECSLPETCVEMLQKAQSELRFTVTGILLDEGNAGMDFSLKPFCQNIYRTSELTGDQIVGEIVLDRV